MDMLLCILARVDSSVIAVLVDSVVVKKGDQGDHLDHPFDASMRRRVDASTRRHVGVGAAYKGPLTGRIKGPFKGRIPPSEGSDGRNVEL